MHLVLLELQNIISQGHVHNQERENGNPVWKTFKTKKIQFIIFGPLGNICTN